MKKDVAILCQYFYPENISSATLPTELAIGLKEKGLSVEVLCGFPKDSKKKEMSLEKELNGVLINRIRYTTFNDKKKIGRILNFFTFFVSMLTKMNYLRRFNTIIVYSNPPILPLIPYYLNKLFNNKYIFVSFDVYPDNALKLNAIKKNGFIHKLMNFVNKRVYGKAYKVILLGNEMKSYVIENGIAKSVNQLEVIPNWYSNELSTIGKDVVNDEYKSIDEKNKFVVLYSGNMGIFQDMNTIMEGLLYYKDDPDILFIFCGHGTRLKEVESFILENNIINVKMYGYLIGTEYTDVLKISDVCIVSLEVGIEGLGVPSKTYGYLAMGKPVIAIMSSETDIAKDIIEYQCGKNIAQGNVSGFINAIDSYKKDPLMEKIHSINAMNLYEDKYTKEISISKYFNLINKKTIETDVEMKC